MKRGKKLVRHRGQRKPSAVPVVLPTCTGPACQEHRAALARALAACRGDKGCESKIKELEKLLLAGKVPALLADGDAGQAPAV